MTLKSGIAVIDCDDCIVDGVIAPWANELIERADSLTEISWSGDGLHIMVSTTVSR